MGTKNSSFENTDFKALRVMPARNSKAKDHVVELERRLELWENGIIIKSIKVNHSRLLTAERSKDIGKISVKFKELTQKSNVNGALKFLTNKMSNGILPLT